MRLTLTLSLVVCVALAGVLVMAQQAPGVVTGTVLDQNGNAVTNFAGGIVQVTNTATAAVFKASVSEKTGEFQFTALPAGTYDLTAPFGGALYQTYNEKGVVVKAGETLAKKIVLGWGMNLGTIGDAPDVLIRDMARKALSMPPQPTPRMPDGKPDFTGVWVNFGGFPEGGGGGGGNPAPGAAPPAAAPQGGGGGRGPQVALQPWAAEKLKQIQAAGPVGPQGARICLPTAQPGWNHVFKFVQAPSTLINIAEESTPGFRQIFLDGRPHPQNWNPAWQGHSIGKWEGDTLVVDTVGFNDEVQIGPIHSDQVHVVERMRRPDMAHLEIEITTEDPGAWMPGAVMKQNIHGVLALDQEILEFICQENNRLPIAAAPSTGGQ
jgi:hypothetical protein